MNHEDSQEEEELRVFREFARVCPISLVGESAENRKPPEPDILCKVADNRHIAFELSQAEDVTTYENKSGKTRVGSVQGKEQAGESGYCIVAPSIVQRVEDKISRKYKTKHPIHLVVWSMTACSAEVDFWREELIELLRNKGMGRFQRIWIVEYKPYVNETKCSVVFNFDKAQLRDLNDEAKNLAELIDKEHSLRSQSDLLEIVSEVVGYAKVGESSPAGLEGRVVDSIAEFSEGSKYGGEPLYPNMNLLFATFHLAKCLATASQKEKLSYCLEHTADKRQLARFDSVFDQSNTLAIENLEEYQDFYS